MWRRVSKKRKKDFNLSFLKEDGFLERYAFVILSFFLYLIFILLFVRLFSLTVVKGGYYKSLSEENRLKEIIIEAPRGEIYDRKGYLIAKSSIGDLLKPNKNLRIIAKREYLFTSASHFIGYVQEVSTEELENLKCYFPLRLGDKAGKMGIEKVFDCILRGKNGKKLIEVNSLGKEVRELAVDPPQKGFNLRTSLDILLQEKTKKIVEEKVPEKKVAIVGLNPTTGEVLLYLSYPDFDPNSFSENLKEVEKYLKDERKPFFDRVANGVYPPGSTFKPFVAISALDEKVIDEKTKIEDTGIVKLGPQTFGNWYFLEYGRKEGLVDVVKAIQRSNDIFFYKVGEKLGVHKIRDWAIKFGFSKLTNIGFPEETGIVPSDFWKRAVIGSRWYLGDTYNLSIGQGYLLVTPLQLAVATASIANNGKICKPLILRPGYQGKPPFWAKEIIETYSIPNCKDLNISKKTLKIVKEGMEKACERGGTGYPFFDFKVKVGCKTGTAESERKSGLPHAWFTVFAPFEKPEIVLVVLVEESGQGSDVAAPIAKEILDYYFSREN